jgi:hypothetical protein
MTGNPFRALGLDADPGLTDDDVRAAWHRVAGATHPDRADGGDPAAFSAAAAAYSDLRSPFGRGEALADLAGRPAARRPQARNRLRRRWRPERPARDAATRPAHDAVTGPARDGAARTARRRRPASPAGRATARAAGRWAAQVRGGRPLRLALLVLGGAAVSILAVIIDGWQPASVALIVGAATWVLRGARRYLGARPAADNARPAGQEAGSSQSGR